MADVALYRVAGRQYRLAGRDRELAESRDPARLRSSSAAGRGGGGAGGPRHLEEADEEGGDEVDASFVKDHPGGGHSVKLAADPELFGFIIGRQGANKSRIEQETGTKITIPRKGSDRNQEIEIRGDEKLSVAAAYRKVEASILSAISGRRLQYTHFVSIPLTSAPMQQRVKDFADKVAKDPRAEKEWGIRASSFQAPDKFHQTIVMLKLYTKGMREAAAQVLKSFEGRFRGSAVPQLAVRGLDIMNDDPSQCRVLFARVNEEGGEGGQLKKLCGDIVEALACAGLLLDKDGNPVKLHATLINSKFAAVAGEQKAGDRFSQTVGRRDTFVASAVLEEHADADFGMHTLNELHLSKRGAYGKDGYYEALAKTSLC